jgi:hypothetical protein
MKILFRAIAAFLLLSGSLASAQTAYNRGIPITDTNPEPHKEMCWNGSAYATCGAPSSAANQTVTQADPGADATKATAVQGVTGGKAVAVSAASLPLPSGASTEATLAAQSAKLPASLGIKTAAASLSVAPASDSKYLIVNMGGVPSGNATYRMSVTNYGGYTTPTDMLTIRGSATKTVVVTSVTIQTQTTVAALQTYYFVKRSTANTGGTATQPTLFPLDSNSAAATAVVDLYSSAPTTGTLAGNVTIALGVSAVPTAAPQTISIGTASSMVDLRQGLTLRGTGESLSINNAGAALGGGYSATIIVELVEY